LSLHLGRALHNFKIVKSRWLKAGYIGCIFQHELYLEGLVLRNTGAAYVCGETKLLGISAGHDAQTKKEGQSPLPYFNLTDHISLTNLTKAIAVERILPLKVS
jgi:hypothetical protein